AAWALAAGCAPQRSTRTAWAYRPACTAPIPRGPGPATGGGSAGSSAVAQALPKDELLDFARGRARQVVDDADLLGPLLPGQAGRAQVCPQRFEVWGVAPRLHPEEGTAVLAQPLVRRRHDRHL